MYKVKVGDRVAAFVDKTWLHKYIKYGQGNQFGYTVRHNEPLDVIKTKTIRSTLLRIMYLGELK